jgi:curved DNA-binding protein CbpA
MDEAASHYEVLGVTTDAPAVDIRQAYLRLARAHHPDAMAGAPVARRAEADLRMQAINAAWTVLGDVRRRREYDRLLGLSDDARSTDTREGFRPFHDPAEDTDPDPRLEPDVPYEHAAPATGARRLATLAPVAVFAASVAAFSFGLFLASAALVVVSGILFLVSCLLLAVVPLLYMSEARRHDP